MFFKTIVSFTLSFVLGGVSLFAQSSLQILHASDLEGGVEAIADAPNFAAVVEALEKEAAQSKIPTILLSAGDNYLTGPFFAASGDRSMRAVFQDVYREHFDRADTYFASLREGAGRGDISIMNVMGFDASALGNHEFDPGTSVLSGALGGKVRETDDGLAQLRWPGVQFPYLSSNLDFSSDMNLAPYFTDSILKSREFRTDLSNLSDAGQAPKIAPSTIIVRGKQRYGVVGVTTPLLEIISSPGNTRVKSPGAGTNDIQALAGILQPVIDALMKESIDKIILLSHLQQFSLEVSLATLLKGVDVIIAGGSDTLSADATDRLRSGDTAGVDYPVFAKNADGKPVAVVSTNGQYSYVGRLVVSFDEEGNLLPDSIDSKVSGAFATDETGVESVWKNRGDAFAPETKGAKVKAITDPLLKIVTARDAEILGKSSVFLEGRRSAVRTQETNLGNLTADANLVAAQAIDPTVLVSLKNGGGIRAEVGFMDGSTGKTFPTRANSLSGKKAGEISKLDIENSLRFNNELTLLTLTAQQLLDALEHSVAATEPGATPGQFPQVSGIAFSFDPSLAPGQRVQTAVICNLDGEVIEALAMRGNVVGDPERKIRIVTLKFLADGGSGYPFEALTENRVDTGVGEQEALMNYLKSNFSEVAFNVVDAGMAKDERIQNLSVRRDTLVGSADSGL